MFTAALGTTIGNQAADRVGQGAHAAGDGDHEPTLAARNLIARALDDTQSDPYAYGALHATIASGRVRLATDGGAKIAR